MTYIQKRIRRRAVQSRNVGLGGVLETLFGGSTPSAAWAGAVDRDRDNQSECLAVANAATSQLDARWYDIAQNWNPSGNFSPTDMNNAINATLKTLSDAQIAVMFAPQSTSDAGEMISQALGDLNTKLKQMAPYVAAVQQAQQSGSSVITSPGFKDWITTSLVAASGAFATRAVLECNVSWLQKAADAIDSVRDVVMRIVDVAIKIGETAIDVVDDTLDAYKYLKWGALALVAYWAITKVKHSANA